jgi:hypothetical protein
MVRPELGVGADWYSPTVVAAAADEDDTAIQVTKGHVHKINCNWKY